MPIASGDGQLVAIAIARGERWFELNTEHSKVVVPSSHQPPASRPAASPVSCDGSGVVPNPQNYLYTLLCMYRLWLVCLFFYLTAGSRI